jgi:hypothetical protein
MSAQVHGFGPGTPVDFELHSTPIALGTRIADASGVAVIEFTVPASFTGRHHVVASGVDADGNPRTVSLAFEVSGSGTEVDESETDPHATLPATGVGGVEVAWRLGLLLMLAGVVLVRGAARRRR